MAEKDKGPKTKRGKTEERAEEQERHIAAELQEARREAQEYLDSLQRLQAEFENYRKRLLREQTAVFENANQALIATLLPILDNFERALRHEAADAGQFAEYRQGVELVYQQLMDTLAKEGLEAIDPLGEEFDPRHHEALMQAPSSEHEENAVIEVFEKGYKFKGRVIRPARVKVAGPRQDE